MNAIDTNILVYRLDRHDPIKRDKARTLLQALRVNPAETVLLWQVAGEFARQLHSWNNQRVITRAALESYARACLRLFPLAVPNTAVFEHAIELSGRYSLSHWDSMIIGACIEAKVDVLYTEDMGAPTRFGTVNLVNPFA